MRWRERKKGRRKWGMEHPKEEVKQKKKGVEKRESTCSHNTGWHRCRGRRKAGRMKVKWALGTPRPNTLLPSPLPFQVMSHLLLL